MRRIFSLLDRRLMARLNGATLFDKRMMTASIAQAIVVFTARSAPTEWRLLRRRIRRHARRAAVFATKRLDLPKPGRHAWGRSVAQEGSVGREAQIAPQAHAICVRAMGGLQREFATRTIRRTSRQHPGEWYQGQTRKPITNADRFTATAPPIDGIENKDLRRPRAVDVAAVPTHPGRVDARDQAMSGDSSTGTSEIGARPT